MSPVMPRASLADTPIHGPDDHIAIAEGCYFDPAAGAYVAQFFSRFLAHSKGRFAGQRFDLIPWQRDLVDRLYGWKRPNGTRRYREGAVFVPKKQGKSTLCSGLELYHLLADGEAGAEIYTGARDRQQASIVFNEARAMLESSPELLRFCEVIPSAKRIAVPDTRSVLQALSADVGSKEGLNASFALIDELHVQADARLYHTLRYAGAARLDPLFLSISTAGEDRETIGFTLFETAEQIAEGTLSDTSFLGVVYAAKPGDDFEDPALWRKVNPSLGYTIHEDDFARELKAAQRNAQDWAAFLRYRLNLWLASGTRFLNAVDWQACAALAVDREALRGRPCHAGLDLASTTDLASFAALFPGNEVLARHWTAAATLDDRARRDKVPYRQWVRDGFLTATDGPVIDYDRIREDILAFHATHPIAELWADPWNASQLLGQLAAAGIPVKTVRQNFAELSQPTKEVQRLVLTRTLRPGPDPVAAWCASNAVALTDGTGNVRLTKKSSRGRIDATAALVNAAAARLAAAVAAQGKKPSVYERRGLASL
jgi:phage terminase large subunit-like protein